MKKWLLIWNIVVTVLMLVLVLGGCSSDTAQFTALQTQVEANKLAIVQLQATVSQQAQQIQTQTAQIAALQTSVQTAISTLQVQLQQFVQQYVQLYAGK